MGAVKDALPDLLQRPRLLIRREPRLGCCRALAPLGGWVTVFGDLASLVNAVAAESRSGDILVMSNGGFGGVHEKLLAKLAAG